VEKTTKACPGCKRPIEKNKGCDHMECTYIFLVPGEEVGFSLNVTLRLIDMIGAKCHVHFCWKCLKPYYASSTLARNTGSHCVCHGGLNEG